ncbi:hypothetical protein McanMca71_001572 [Microsporum canis]
MGFHSYDTLNKHHCVGVGGYAYVYHVSPTIVVKTVRPDRDHEEEKVMGHPLQKDIAFYKCLNERQDRCPHIVECFLIFPEHLFLSFCANKAIIYRFHEYQERENDHFFGRLIRVKDYEDPTLIARWIQQLTSALEYVERMGFCHNDLNTSNCLLDERLNLKLSDFGRATTIGQLLEYTRAPWAVQLAAGPLEGTYGLCSARTEQFAVGSLLYYMVYGHKPYEDINLDWPELERRFEEMRFPELNRHEIFDSLIFGCWYNVYPTMALVAYDFKRKTKDIALIAEYTTIDRTKETKTCEALPSVTMNSLIATPPVPPHFYETSCRSPSYSMSSTNTSVNRKRKAEDDCPPSGDTRMSASPSGSPALHPRPLAPRHLKRPRPNVSGRPLSLPRLMETLDTDALRSVLRSLCDRHPEIASEVMHTAPRPSVSAALEVLSNYQSTLQSSFPLGGNPSSDYAYNRVRQHLTNLLEALNDFTPHFLPPNESQPSTSLSYLDGATDIIHRLPRWTTPQHNIEKYAAYEEMSKAWSLVIREAAKRGGGIQLQYGGWDQKLAKHNETAGGKLQDALNELNQSLGWIGGNVGNPCNSSQGDVSSIRQQLMSGTYGAGLPLKVGPW